MTEQNIEQLRRAWDAYDRGDVDGFPMWWVRTSMTVDLALVIGGMR
jgi:hypothetical protein